MEEIIYWLQKKLRGLKKVVKPSWSFVLARAVKVLETYPSGVTETIILSELYQEYIRTGGRLGLTQEASSGQTSTVGSIHENRAIDYESLLEAVCTRLWTLPGTTTSVISLKDPGHGEGEEEEGARQVDMYLHRKFQNCTEMLVTHTLRLTRCRLEPALTGRHSQSFRLLPTEHLIVLLSPHEEEQMTNKFVSLREIKRSDLALPGYIDAIHAKIVDVNPQEIVHSSDGSIFRRVIVTLCGGGNSTSVQLMLWDDHTCLARLLSKGDTLFLERPYGKPAAGSKRVEADDWTLEIGPATILFLGPSSDTEVVLPSQASRVPVHVKKTDQGDFNFGDYPVRLLVADLVPRMKHAVLLAWSTSDLMDTSCSNESGKVCRLHLKDNTGSVVCDVHCNDHRMLQKIHSNQWLLLTGLSSHTRQECGSLYLLCDTTQGASIHTVSGLVGWLRSPCLLSLAPLGEAVASNSPHFTTVVTLTSWLPVSSTGHQESGNSVKRIHSFCGGEVMDENSKTLCTFCRSEAGPWRWCYSLQCSLRECKDSEPRLTGQETSTETMCSINATLTPSAAEMLIQVPAPEFVSLSPANQRDILNGFINHSLVLCISNVVEKETGHIAYQINAVCEETETS